MAEPRRGRSILSCHDELGYITADVEQRHRKGKTPRYSLDRGRLVADAGQMLAYIVS